MAGARSPQTGPPGLPLLELAGAYAVFALSFRGPRERFWQRMTLGGLALGTLALAGEPSLRRTRIGWKDLVRGAAAAAALYQVFRAGDRAARALRPSGGAEIEDVYGLRRLRPEPELALRLAAVIAPAEELFWRGLVQRRLTARFGRRAGGVAAAAAYGGAHLVTGNPTLVAAASVAGGFWSLLAAAGIPMGTLIVSHALWDLWIFLVSPTSPRGGA